MKDRSGREVLHHVGGFTCAGLVVGLVFTLSDLDSSCSDLDVNAASWFKATRSATDCVDANMLSVWLLSVTDRPTSYYLRTPCVGRGLGTADSEPRQSTPPRAQVALQLGAETRRLTRAR